MSFGESAGITQSEFIDDFLPLDCRGFQTLVWQKVLSEWKLISVHESVEVDARDLIVKRNQGSSSMNRTRSGRRN